MGPAQRIVMRLDASFELSVLCRIQNFLKAGPRTQTQLNEVVSSQQTLGLNLLTGRFRNETSHEFEAFQMAMAGQAIEPVKLEVLIKAI